MTQRTAPAARPKTRPFDPLDGSTHPPALPTNGTQGQNAQLQSASRWMRGAMVREFVKRLRRRGRAEGRRVRGRMRKRKAALAMSAAVMSLSTAATSTNLPGADVAISAPAFNPTITRVPAEMIEVSDAMTEALAEEEGVRLTVYRDVAGYPTVGVGHLVTPADNLRVGDRISYERAVEFLEQDLAIAADAVRRVVGDLKLYQHEFDALVDLVYNVGEGNVSRAKSPALNAAIDAGDYDAIARELAYHHAAGSKANGLVYRSERRQAIFMDAMYEDPRPDAIAPDRDYRA